MSSSSIPSDLLSKAVQIAIQQTVEKNKTENQIEQLYSALNENQELENEISDVLPSTHSRILINEEKDAIIEEKQKQLIDLQNLFLRMKSKKEDSKNRIESWEPVPIVINRVQDLIAKLSEQSIEEKTSEIPILSILKVNTAINQLYDQCVQYGYINESPEMKKQRITEFAQMQKNILDNLNENIH